MKPGRILPLYGPNIWARQQVLEAHLDVGAWPKPSADAWAQAHQLLTTAAPDLAQVAVTCHTANAHAGGTCDEVVRTVAALSALLQRRIAIPAPVCQVACHEPDGAVRFAVGFEEEQTGRAAINAACDLVAGALNGQAPDIPYHEAWLRELLDRVGLGPSTKAIVRAAQKQHIPVRRLNQGSFVQLGHGSAQRRIHTAETTFTGVIAEEIASDKELTKDLLKVAGVPVPGGRAVDSAADAWEAAQEIGPPVVVKPRDGNHGRGVFTCLTQQDEVQAAYDIAVHEGSGVLVERFAFGLEHRLLVVDGKLVAAARGDPLIVIGNGRDTVRKLVDDQLNSDPRRGDLEEHPLNLVRFDKLTLLLLKQQGLEPDNVANAGQEVLLSYNGNVSIDVTDEVHPEVAARAVDAARVVGLDIAGLDVVTRDISQPLESQGGVVVEVNAGPGLLMHVFPAQGKPRPVGEAIVNSMFRDGGQGRIPLIGLLKTPSSELIDQAIWQVLLAAGPGAGRSGLDGAGIDGRQLLARVPTEKAAADALLANVTVHRALLSVSASDVLNHGLAVDQLRMAVLGRLTGADQDTREAARVLVESVAGSGSVVVPAADPVARALVRHCAKRVILIDADPRLPSLQAHRDQGHVVLFVAGGNIHLARGEYEVVLMPLRRLVQHGHLPRHSLQVEAALTAAAVGWAIRLSGAAMRTGLAEFLR